MTWTDLLKVVVLLWLNINVLYVYWRLCRANQKGEA